MSLVPTGSFMFAVDLAPIKGHEGAQILVAEVAQGNELNAALAMANDPRINQNTVFITAEDDKVKNALPQSAAVVSSQNPAQDLTENFRGYLPGSVMPKETRQQYRQRFRNALILAIVPAAGTTGGYIFISSKYMLMSEFAFGYAVAALFAIYVHKWFKAAHGAGVWVSSLVHWYTSFMGKNRNEVWEGRAHRFGEILAAYGLNVFSQSGVGLVGGTLTDAAHMGAAFTNALTATDESVDFQLKKVFGEEKVTQVISPLRMVFFSFLNMFAIAGVKPVQYTLATFLVSIALAHVFKDLVDPAVVGSINIGRKTISGLTKFAKGVYGYAKNAIVLRMNSRAACEGELTEPIRIEARNKDAA